MNDLIGRTALVTGAAQGLGRVYVDALLAQGVRVAAADIKPVDLDRWAEQAKAGDVIGLQLDVATESSVQKAINAAVEHFGKLDILINNASIAVDLDRKPLIEMEAASWERVMNVNAKGAFLCMREAAKVMVAQRYGKIVNVASTTVLTGEPRMLHYVASKGAVIGMTRVAARELGEHGVTVNCIAPGLTMTDAIRATGAFGGEAYQAKIRLRSIPREQVADDLCGAMLFLSSAQSDFITGQTLTVDGGAVML
ncbi:NAD(P)-dependent dehydrogenase, short-chain alcohol dehydrogenase family [Variovorax sp. HW608]|uniref:SDR family NAD(P)-dependent oxidoreductase n=1 Tax=Variovorax sp. HW608 TaxID=1034889 RepID=UPI00081F815C|nr:SDR family oxidoreductase [Variovorax sp. HW608]SCK14874.1 NAD(P)-dependent dehydrogenase, short-chain alcohol dehydrogenase family [Variovorax sp. HW608]